MLPDRKRLLWLFLFLLLFGAGIYGGYFFVSKRLPKDQAHQSEHPQPSATVEDTSVVRVYYPWEGRLLMEERRIRRSPEASIVELTVTEFLAGPSNTARSLIPAGTRLLGSYRGSDGVMYVDLSDEFRRNFQGDALTEFLLLKGLYESVISNVEGVDDVKVLVEGKEIESVGGHLVALYPLKGILTEER